MFFSVRAKGVGSILTAASYRISAEKLRGDDCIAELFEKLGIVGAVDTSGNGNLFSLACLAASRSPRIL